MLVGQIVRSGANRAVAPPPGAMGQMRCVVVWMCEGGGARHTHPVLAGQVWAACMVAGWVVGMKGRW